MDRIKIDPLALYRVQDLIPLFGFEHLQRPERAVERIFRKGELKGRLPSKKQGWQTIGQAVIDYFMVKK